MKSIWYDNVRCVRCLKCPNHSNSIYFGSKPILMLRMVTLTLLMKMESDRFTPTQFNVLEILL